MDATQIVAIAFFALGQSFSDGVQAYNGEDYPAATVAFSHVVKQAPADSPFHDIALFWRACAFSRNGKDGAAERDLDHLLERVRDPLTQRDAETLYRRITGVDWIGTGLISPEKAWAAVVARIKARDERFLPRCFTGAMLEDLVAGLAREESWDELNAVAQMTLSHVDYDASRVKATVVLRDEDGNDAMALIAVKKGRFWRFAEQADVPGGGKASTSAAADRRAGMTDSERLTIIRQLMEAYVIDQGRMPDSLASLRKYSEEFDAVSVSARGGEPFIMSTPTRNVELPASPWVFSEACPDGQRALLYFGRVHMFDEAAFVELAREHGVRWSDVPLEELAEQEARELSQWIDALGSDVFDTRSAAYRKLKAAGERARKLLEAAQDHDDPEIAFQVKKLLEAL